MSRGLTWSSEEIKCLIEIWAEEQICQMLDTTHKNTEVYKLVSQRMSDRGFRRSLEQCRAKAKQLRQQYVKVRDQLGKSGSSGDERDKFPWFDDLDKILGTKPVVEPVDIVDSSDATSSSTCSSDSAPNSTSVDAEPKDGAEMEDENVADAEPLDNTLESTDMEETASESKSQTPRPHLPIPGSQSRKRKARSSVCGELHLYLTEQNRHLEQMHDAEQHRQAQETAALENMLRLQQEADERRFNAMQAQQSATQHMFMQLIGTVISALHQQPHSSYNSTSFSPPAFSSPTHVPPGPPMMPVPPRQHLPYSPLHAPQPPVHPQHVSQPGETPNHSNDVSSVLNSVNKLSNSSTYRMD